MYGLALSHPFHVESRQLAKFLLPASVVALGFGMNLHGPARVDGDAASDRDRAEQGDAQEGWRSATSAGDHTVDHRWRRHVVADPVSLDWSVATRNPGELRAKLLFINFDEYSDGAPITGRFKRAICANRYPVVFVNLDDFGLD